MDQTNNNLTTYLDRINECLLVVKYSHVKLYRKLILNFHFQSPASLQPEIFSRTNCFSYCDKMDFIPSENSDYHSVNYWNNRFAQEENYEWCGAYDNFKTLINQYVPKTDSILIVGEL